MIFVTSSRKVMIQDYSGNHTENTVSPAPPPPPLHHGRALPPAMGRHRSVRSALPPKNHHPPAKQNIHVYNVVRCNEKVRVEQMEGTNSSSTAS